MTTDHGIVAFAVAVGILTILPGADTMLVLRSVISRGRVAGFATVLGICAGLLVQATFSALGLSAVLASSANAYSAVKIAGALYLIGLGAWTLLGAWRSRQEAAPGRLDIAEQQAKSVGLGRGFLEGLLTNVLNPKVAVFYLAFLPQFIAPGQPVLARSLLLAGVHVGLTLVWLTVIALAVGALSSALSRPAMKRRVGYATGAVLTTLGLKLAFDR